MNCISFTVVARSRWNPWRPSSAGSLESLRASERWAAARRDELGAAQMESVKKAMADHEAEQEAKRIKAGASSGR